MRVRRNVRVHPQRHGRRLPHPARALGQRPQLRLALHIEQQDAGFQRRAHLLTRLPHAGEHDLVHGFVVHGQHPLQFTAGNHVVPAALLCQQPQDPQVGIGFYGIADGVPDLAEGALERPQPRPNRSRGVHIEGGPQPLHQLRQRNLLATQHGARRTPQQSLPHLTIGKGGRTG